MVANLGESLVRAYNKVGSLLNPKMSQIFLRGHVEACFELSKKATEGEIGLFREFSDGDIVPIVFVKKLKSGPKFFVFA